MNAEIEIKTTETFSDFLTEIERISEANSSIWFRGNSNQNYSLSPSIYRGDYQPKYEQSFQTKFKSRALPYLTNRPVENYWEWLFIMQHHGVPTRLLDWSSSALVALGFAIMFRGEDADTDAAIWCLNPISLNERTRVVLTPEDKIPDISVNQNAQASFKIDAAARADYPIAITGPLNNKRIAAQKGTFTLFPNTHKFNLEDKDEAHNFLTKIIIPNANIESFKKQLYYLGMTESTIYPDLNNLALEIKREFNQNLEADV
jgi:hypothetical protein